MTVSGRHDVMQLGAGQNALTESNILSSLLSRGDSRLSMVNRGEAVYEHEWCHGVSTFAGARMQRIFANRYVPMLRPDGTPVNSVSDVAASVGLRLSKNDALKTVHSRLSIHFPAAVQRSVLPVGIFCGRYPPAWRPVLLIAR